MIGFLPGAEAFLGELLRRGKRITILTNAHRAGVDVKTAKTGLDRQGDRIVGAFEVGYLKMRAGYWPTCQQLGGFGANRSLFVDDDGSCLDAAKGFGIVEIIHSAKSSSQLPPSFSTNFASVEELSRLVNGRDDVFS